MFCVVKTVEDEDYAYLVPSSWIHGCDEVYWPNIGEIDEEVFSNMIISNDPPNTSWKTLFIDKFIVNDSK